jgi:hypothetical protein
MFGNLMGWIISAVIAAAGIYGGYALMLAAEPTAPTHERWTQLAHTPLDLSDVATAALPAMNDPKNDAGDLYRQAAADFDNHQTEYVNLQTATDFDPVAIEELKGIDAICQATKASSMHLFSTHPEEVVGFDNSVAVLDKLGEIETAMTHAIMSAKAIDAKPRRLDLARKYATAIEAMGYRLYQERAALIELDQAEKFMGEGSELLTEIARAEQNDAAVSAQDAFRIKRVQQANDIITEVRKYVTSQGQSMIGKYAGDMFALAQDPTTDRVWRVEAIRKLGRLQFNAESIADQKKAPKVLRKLADDTSNDLVIRTAAAKARDMTSYDNQSQR